MRIDQFFDLDDTVPFARYRGYTISEVARRDPDFLKWAWKNTDWGSANFEAIEAALERERINKAANISAPNLTDHQQEKANKLLEVLKDDEPGIVRLEGGAGYGKSYVTQELARELILAGYEVNATAVSYVATQVLARQLDKYGVSCGTLARKFKFTKEYNDGVEVYAHSEDTPLAIHDLTDRKNVLIIDECSMIHNRDANVLFDIWNRENKGKIILVGDLKQLPPVKQEYISRCCGNMDPDLVAELQVPMRYDASSPLHQVEQLMRHHPYNIDALRTMARGDALALARDINHMVDLYVQQYNNDPDALHRMLLFRRDQVTHANDRIRGMLFGEDTDEIGDGEQLMVLTTADYQDRRYYSGEIFSVFEYGKGVLNVTIGEQEFSIPHWQVAWTDSNGNLRHDSPRLIFGISDTRLDPSKLGSAELKEALDFAREYAKDAIDNKQMPRKEAWAPYWKLKSSFVTVAYMYATSVHRAQGQTCDYAYCSPRTLLSVPGIMGQALAYVATTRARKNLTLVL